MRRRDALIRFYFKEDPTKLGDEEYAKTWAQLNFVLKENVFKAGSNII